jgi:small subunit ribosomal protein S15
MLTKEEKEEILKEEEKNTGGCEAQILLLSEQIKKLFAHLKGNHKDLHSKRGLLGMVNKRKKLLLYLKKQDEKKYQELIKKIGLKK